MAKYIIVIITKEATRTMEAHGIGTINDTLNN